MAKPQNTMTPSAETTDEVINETTIVPATIDSKTEALAGVNAEGSATAEATADGAKPAKEKKASTPRQSAYNDADTIHFAEKSPAVAAEGDKPATDAVKYDADANNPKRAGSASRERFAKYVDGGTVGAFVAAVGDRAKALADLKYDSEHKLINITKAAVPAAAPATEAPAA